MLSKYLIQTQAMIFSLKRIIIHGELCARSNKIRILCLSLKLYSSVICRDLKHFFQIEMNLLSSKIHIIIANFVHSLT